MPETARPSRWKAFWDDGRWWKAVLLAVVYLGIYLGAGWVSGQLFGSMITTGGVFGSVANVLIVLTFALVVGAVVLVAFIASVGWFRELFGPQPIRGRWWMWIAPAIPVIAIVLRLFGIDYASYPGGVVVVTLITGLLVGFVEEVLTRGIAVKILRDSGMREWGVAVVSSLIFALLHTANLFSMAPPVVVLTVAYTFAFGVLMYLTLRVTGNLIWPIIIHGLTDPTLFLASGGIDSTGGAQNVFLSLAAPANFVTIAFAIIALIFIRGRVARPDDQMSSSTVVTPA
jgi:membrane protease YdiL (CAAX protease family)